MESLNWLTAFSDFWLYLSQHVRFHVKLDKSISFQKSIHGVLFTRKSIWTESQNYKQDLWRLAEATFAPRSGGPQWICSPSVVSPTPGNYPEHMHPCTLTFKGSQPKTLVPRSGFMLFISCYLCWQRKKPLTVFHSYMLLGKCVWGCSVHVCVCRRYDVCAQVLLFCKLFTHWFWNV